MTLVETKDFNVLINNKPFWPTNRKKREACGKWVEMT